MAIFYSIIHPMLLTIKLQAAKLITVYIGLVILNVIMLTAAISDAGWGAIAVMVSAAFSFAGLVFIALINKKVNQVVKGVDGITHELIQTKTTEAKAIGIKEATDAIAKETAAKNEGELQAIKNQALKDTRPK